jgi:hypothetical protein
LGFFFLYYSFLIYVSQVARPRQSYNKSTKNGLVLKRWNGQYITIGRTARKKVWTRKKRKFKESVKRIKKLHAKERIGPEEERIRGKKSGTRVIGLG